MFVIEKVFIFNLLAMSFRVYIRILNINIFMVEENSQRFIQQKSIAIDDDREEDNKLLLIRCCYLMVIKGRKYQFLVSDVRRCPLCLFIL